MSEQRHRGLRIITGSANLPGDYVPVAGCADVEKYTRPLTADEVRKRAEWQPGSVTPAAEIGSTRMFAMQFELPPSVNGYWNSWKGRLRLSAKGREFREHVAGAWAKEDGRETMTGRLRLDLWLHAPERAGWRGRWDLDNRIKPLLDALQHVGAFVDDAQFDSLNVERGVPMGTGLAIVVVTEMEVTT